MQTPIPEFLLAAVGTFALRGIYEAIERHWPTKYLDTDELASRATQLFTGHYLVFRSLPPFLIAIVLAVTSERLGMSALLTIALLYVFQIVLLIRDLWRHGRPGRREALVRMFGQLIVAVTLCSAWLLRTSLAGIVPLPDALLEGVWTAGLTGAVFYAVAREVRREPSDADIEKLVQRGRRSAGARSLGYLRARSRELQIDPICLEAIIIAESLQRPPWFRRLERIAQWTVMRGHPMTTGVAQIMSSRPLTDEESIDKLLASFVGWLEIHGTGDVHPAAWPRLEQFVRTHNTNPALIDVVFRVYTNLDPTAELDDGVVSDWD